MNTVQDYADRLGLQFSSDDVNRAHEEWGCNCGPAALAAVLGITLEAARDCIPKFTERRYTSPTMMKAALNQAAATYREIGPSSGKILPDACPHVLPSRGLVRVQWTGPWTAPGSNPKWAYRMTHWFSTFMLEPRCAEHLVVFDVNCGPVPWEEWVATMPPALTASMPRADGEWYLTHLWEVVK